MRSFTGWIAGAVAFLVLGGAVAHAQPCFTPLTSLGPVDPADGFPAYYIDSNGLPLQKCLDLVCDPALPIPDPHLPISFPDNYPVEVFYHRAIAKLAAGTVSSTYTAALEGSFANGSVALAGDQIVFTRIRLRLLGGVPSGTYTFTHPYGVNVLTADNLGTVNFTQNVGVAPGVFTGALNGGVGPFLTAVAPPPPVGLIGTAVNQTVTGSPCGTNLFSVQGPGLPNGVLQTNQFSTIIGRRAAICGNGFLDPGEQCDDGNTLAGDCCDPTCMFEANNSPCASNVCRTGMRCNGAGVCGGGAVNTAPCDDGNACTTADTCANGTCVGGPAPNCDDGNVCTTDSCDPASGCVSTPNTLPCDDGMFCTINDTCSGGVCSGAPFVCPTAAPVGVVLADAYVDSGSPTTKLGAKTSLRISSSPVRNTFVRVQVTGIGNRNVTSAVLHLKVSSASGSNSVAGGSIHQISDCSWDEHLITSKTQPVIDGPVLATVGAVKLKQLVDFDVTSAVTGDGTYCFAIDSPSKDLAIYNSREATSGKPTFTVDAACPCTGGGPAPTCGDNQVNQPSEQCDGTADAACPGRCQANCTCAPVPPAPRCGDNIVNQPSEQCDGTSSAACPGLCQANCTCGTPPSTATASVVADTFVESDLPGTNLGSNVQLSIDAGPAVKQAFLRVTVSGVGASHVSSAVLHIQDAKTTNAQSVSGGTIHAITNCTWDEHTMTWDTRPAIDGPGLATQGAVALGQAVTLDLTSAVPGDGTYCFAIDSTSTDGVDYNSREASTGKPTMTISVTP